MGNFWKNLILSLTLFASIDGIQTANNFSNENYTAIHKVANTTPQIYSGKILETRDLGQEVHITNTSLHDAICDLLGKEKTEKIFSKDFLEHPDYKATIPDGEMIPRANKNCLNLSGTGVKDITELIQFEFPETLQAIDLSNNGITNSDIPKLANFITLSTESEPIVIGENTFAVHSNFSTIINKINLNDNQIDLTTLDSAAKNITKFIYGFQFLPNTNIMKPESIKSHYLIRPNDSIYLSFHLIIDGIEFNLKEDKVSSVIKPLTDDIYHGEYEIKIDSIPSSETAYFKNYSKSSKFLLYDIKLQDDKTITTDKTFKIERNKPFIINTKLIEFYGLTATKITHFDYPTSSCGIFDFEITVESGVKNYKIPLKYTVVDTIAPEIILIGDEVLYCRKNNTFEDPGCIAKDFYKEDITADIITTVTSDNGETFVNVTKLGTYEITYTITDGSGNTATTKRTVIVQEMVLDKITIRINSDKFQVGKDIIIFAEPQSGVPVNNYKDFTYNWYINNIHYQTTTGDSQTGKTQTHLKLDKIGEVVIKVELTATQKVDGKKISAKTETINLYIEPAFRNDNTIILASAIAVSLVIFSIMFVTIIKAKKAKKSTHTVSKKKEVKKEENNIQVIKDYSPTNPNNVDTNKLFNSNDNDKK